MTMMIMIVLITMIIFIKMIRIAIIIEMTVITTLVIPWCYSFWFYMISILIYTLTIRRSPHVFLFFHFTVCSVHSHVTVRQCNGRHIFEEDFRIYKSRSKTCECEVPRSLQVMLRQRERERKRERERHGQTDTQTDRQTEEERETYCEELERKFSSWNRIVSVNYFFILPTDHLIYFHVFFILDIFNFWTVPWVCLSQLSQHHISLQMRGTYVFMQAF